MPSTYKTPGVYVEEISKFPPSVAAVDTAIPAFIGYTEIAEKNGVSLLNVPTRIESFLEFEQYFGGPPSRNVTIRLNAANQYLYTEQKGNTFLLYDSIRLFYDNGGGICYIVAVGGYDKPPAIGNVSTGLLGGLKALEKYDEPTLILSPDATTLGAGLYTFQVQALAQCNDLQDRFLICDLRKNDEHTTGQTHDDLVAEFRDNIGINFLKYGAAYTPWLQTSLDAGLRFRDVIFALESDPSPTPTSSLALLTGMTTTGALSQLIYDLSNAVDTVNKLQQNLKPGGGGFVDAGVADVDAQLKKLQQNYMQLYNDPAKNNYTLMLPGVTAIYQRIADIIAAVKTINDGLPTVVSPVVPVPSLSQTVEFKMRNDIAKIVTQFRQLLSSLATHHQEILQKSGTGKLIDAANANVIKALTLAGLPTTLANIPTDASVQVLYRILAAKIALMDQLSKIANGASVGPTATDGRDAVLAVIPDFTTLKASIDAEITTAKAGAANPAAVITNLNNKLTNVATPDKDKVIVAIAKSYADEENKVKAPAATNDLVPTPPGVPGAFITAMVQVFVDAQQKANAAAITGTVKADVANALTYTPVEAKEYSYIAAGVAGNVGPAVVGYYKSLVNTASTYEDVFDQSLMQTFGNYKTFMTKAGQSLMILPPGAAIAGVYTNVDNNRGVWKAPANVSLASVLGPYLLLNTKDQESLNVDDNAGKSINVIRAFTGKGTIVWGTRTLAGNDNEWRYIPVRRFFNYAEESIKKATGVFVFEPNDINTWIRVKAMIENFLILEWRRGALAGAKPNDAFYVKIGLGETMTALDILEGRMIVEIGMAVVRPAEFIILRFAHKMQES